MWEIRPSEGKQEGFPRAEQAGHSQGQSHLAGVSGFALSKGNLTLAHHSGLAIARLPLTVPPNREGYRPPDYATILYEKNKQPSVARQKKYLVIILEIPEFSPSCPKLRRASLRRTRQRLVQLVLEMCNLDLTTLPSPAHLFPPLLSRLPFTSPPSSLVLASSRCGVICLQLCSLQSPHQLTRNPRRYLM